MSKEVVAVSLGERSYDIAIGAGNNAAAGAFLLGCRDVEHAVVVTDENVRSPHAETVAKSLSEAGVRVDLLVTPPGEESKAPEVLFDLWNQMLAVGADRRSVVVGIGGGVVGDLAGFAAASFARGIDFLQVPTTLLAMVDSSVGGKVGVNLPAAKNMVGAFWQPIGVLADLDVLTTLPKREFLAGLAEVVKYGVIMDAPFFAELERDVDAVLRREPEALARVIAHCCRLKAQVVAEDEKETSGRRAILNYGHTFAHAFEATCGYGEMLHGEAVAVGMICESHLAERPGHDRRQDH